MFEKSSARFRDWLTPEEAKTVAEIDALEAAFKERQGERMLIANRAIQRARAHDRRAHPDVMRAARAT